MTKTDRALREKGNERGSLNRERVIEAALQIVDREGLDALSMRRLGAELQVDPMAVYHYIPNKSALLDSIGDAIMTELGVAPAREPEMPWDIWVIEMFRAYWTVLRAHPQALEVVATRPVVSETGMRSAERILSELQGAGLTLDESIHVLQVFMTMVCGMALAEAGHTPNTLPDMPESEVAKYCGGLPEDEFPCVTAAAGSSAWMEWDTIYDCAARSFLDGIKLRLAERGHSC